MDSADKSGRVRMVENTVRPCATTRTPSGLPIVDVIEPGCLYIAVGGNSHAAKSSVEIGQMAAQLLQHDLWTSDLDRSLFAL
jgi:glycine/D-amino acid oxidase-like deaminating enzyme